MQEKYFRLLEIAYKLTDNVTPQSFDCGEICNTACCGNLSHSKHKSGMALLPYEKDFLKHLGAEDFEYVTGDDGDVLICNGFCNRNLRPFACRIFPYYASISNDGIRIRKDPRAASVCPLLTSREYKRANIYFLRNVKKAVRILISDTIYHEDFFKTSEFIDSLYDLYSKMQ